MPENTINLKLFISYAHDDDPYFKLFSDGLKKIIKNTENYNWSVWDDTKIHVGTFWDEEIQKNIKDCNVAMLLVSVGFMASTYIKENEFKEFTKRYSEKGILIVPVVFKPCDFNAWADLGKLQFYKPSGSNYGKSDIEHFTFADLIKFRETDGMVIPNPNTDRYLIDLVKKTEESFKEFVKPQETPKVNISGYLGAINTNKLSDYPKPSVLFTGRKREIDDFKKAFDSFRLFVVEGLGGTGKTDFVSKCIDVIISDKTKIIWLNGSSQSNFDVFIENAGYGDVLKGEKKTDLALYSGLKDLIEKDQRIIFWDNFNDYEDLAFSKFLSFANQYLRRSTIVLITKTDPSIVGITSLPIIRLEGLNKDALVYAKKLKASNMRYSSILDSDLEKICIGVEGHPLAIEFSMWLMGYGKKADDILQHIPEFSGLKKVEEFSKRLFLDIFNHPSTSDEEREYFLKCSVFKERINGNELKYIYDGKDVFHLLAGLIDKLLITSKEGFYEIHPLVRSFSYDKLVEKKPVHKKAAEYFITQRKLIVSPSLEEKIFYHLSEAEEYEIIADSIQDLGRKLIKQGQLNMLNEFMNRLVNSGFIRPIFEIFYGDIAQIKAEWDNAITHYEKASENVADKDLKAEGIIKHGEILFRRGEVKKSLPYFEDAVIFSKKNGLVKEESRAINDIGLVCYSSDDFDQASTKFMEAIKIRKSINDWEGVASTYNNLGNLFSDKNKYERALEFYNAGLKINEEAFNKTEISLNLLNIGILLRKQGNLKEALEKFNVSLKLQESIGDKEIISRCLNSIGVIYMEQNHNDLALLKYEESIKLNLEVGDKVGLASTYSNLGSYYLRNKIYDKSLDYFFKSLDLFRQIGFISNQKNVLGGISEISNHLGKVKFKELATQVHLKMEPEIKKNLIIEDFFHEPYKNKAPKIGRNDPCYCRSGKKYKHCHGKIGGN